MLRRRPRAGRHRRAGGTRTPGDAVRWALDQGARRVVMTLGEEGALLATADGVVHVPARQVEVRDTTGCGDAVVAGLIAALLAGCDDETAVGLGVVAGATTARAFGSDAGVAGLAALRAAAQRLPVRTPRRAIA